MTETSVTLYVRIKMRIILLSKMCMIVGFQNLWENKKNKFFLWFCMIVYMALNCSLLSFFSFACGMKFSPQNAVTMMVFVNAPSLSCLLYSFPMRTTT